jgi:RecJ-like exonuclease
VKVKEITETLGKNFWTYLECEYCGAVQKPETGYLDGYYMTEILPALKCRSCGASTLGSAAIENNSEFHTSGRMMNQMESNCPHCKGTGKVRYYHGALDTCPTCHGSGNADDVDEEVK